MPHFTVIWERAIAVLWFGMVDGSWWEFAEWADGSWTAIDKR